MGFNRRQMNARMMRKKKCNTMKKIFKKRQKNAPRAMRGEQNRANARIT
jgi:hypothetical protein